MTAPPVRRIAAVALTLAAAACGFNEGPQRSNLLGATSPTAVARGNASDAEPENPAGSTNATFVNPNAVAPAGVTLSALGGAIVAKPRVQLIAFNHDTEAASLQNFLVAWAHSRAWAEMTAEYGIGALDVAPLLDQAWMWASDVSGGVRTADSNTDIEAALIANLDGSSGQAAPWGPADANTVYVLQMPAGIDVSPTPGAVPACDAKLMGWHGAVNLPKAQMTVPYVVIPACKPGQNPTMSSIDSKTFALSHVLVGAVTDPTGQGFAAIDSAHAAWQLVSETPEAGGLCNQAMFANPNLSLHRADVPQALARTWSNAAAALGRVPCVPAMAGEVFLAAAPQLQDAVGVGLSQDLSFASATTVGLALAPGAAQAVPLALTSAPNNAGAFNVAVQEMGTQDLTLSLSGNSGRHGQTLNLTVALAAKPSAVQQVVRVTASQGDNAFSQYFVVRAASANGSP